LVLFGRSEGNKEGANEGITLPLHFHLNGLK